MANNIHWYKRPPVLQTHQPHEAPEEQARPFELTLFWCLVLAFYVVFGTAVYTVAISFLD